VSDIHLINVDAQEHKTAVVNELTETGVLMDRGVVAPTLVNAPERVIASIRRQRTEASNAVEMILSFNHAMNDFWAVSFIQYCIILHRQHSLTFALTFQLTTLEENSILGKIGQIVQVADFLSVLVNVFVIQQTVVLV
jgi:hypothetical protein